MLWPAAHQCSKQPLQTTSTGNQIRERPLYHGCLAAHNWQAEAAFRLEDLLGQPSILVLQDEWNSLTHTWPHTILALLIFLEGCWYGCMTNLFTVSLLGWNCYCGGLKSSEIWKFSWLKIWTALSVLFIICTDCADCRVPRRFDPGDLFCTSKVHASSLPACLPSRQGFE